MSIFDDELRRLLREGVPPAAAAKRTIDWAQRGLLVEYVLPYVEGRATHIARQMARAVENQQFRAARIEPRRLGHQLFSVGGVRISWREATRDQHRARALWQREMGDRCYEDADRHERAEKLLADHGIECLGDLPEDMWSSLVDTEPEQPRPEADEDASGEAA